MDDDPAFFSRATVAIAGLGLMGGSLALALRGKCASLIGFDPDPEVVALALKMGAVDACSTRPTEILPKADLVVLAAPVFQIIRLLEDLPSLHPGGAIVLDLGSTKERIVETMAALPERFDPIGGHPMCGKEHGGLAYADAALFQGANFAFTPLQRTSARARSAVAELAALIGALPLWMQPDVHDRWAAATSHLPYLVACMVSAVVPPETSPLAGPGYRGVTRLAESPPEVMMDVLATNRENILHVLQNFQRELEWVNTHLAHADHSILQERLTRARAQRRHTLKTT